jgi:hypothetical protein
MRLFETMLCVCLCGCAVTLTSQAEGAPTRSRPQNDGTCGNLSNVVNVLWVEGQISTWPARCDTTTAHELAQARLLAARDLACAPDMLSVYTSAIDGDLIVAEGCERRAAYFYFTAGYDSSRNLPGYEGYDVWTNIHLLTRLTPERATAALAGVNAFIASTHTKPNMPSADDLIHLYVDLLQSAARDLDCSVEEIVPFFVPMSPSKRIPVAEGCGARATYLPVGYGKSIFLLSALLHLSSHASHGP